MNIDVNTVFNFVLTALLGYISWSFKERDAQKDKRIQTVETDMKEVRKVVDKDLKEIRVDLTDAEKEMRGELSEAEKKIYRDFVTKEQHDMDINALTKKLDEMNIVLREIYKDIGKLIGRERTDG